MERGLSAPVVLLSHLSLPRCPFLVGPVWCDTVRHAALVGLDPSPVIAVIDFLDASRYDDAEHHQHRDKHGCRDQEQ